MIEVNAKYRSYHLLPNWRQLGSGDSSNSEINALDAHTYTNTHIRSHPSVYYRCPLALSQEATRGKSRRKEAT